MSYIPEELVKRKNKLALGLNKLGPDFIAKLCFACKGHGEYEQTYTAGCGQGTFKSLGHCDWCAGVGVLVKDNAASISVFNQIIQAAENS